MAFAENLKRLRRERYLSQDELARRSNVARQTIYRYERGSVAPLGRTVRALAEALGVEPQELAAPEETAEEARGKALAA
jgi:transcriptional regulator with XRE-family HTH domain